MCIAIPGKLIKKENEKGIVDLGGVNKEIFLTFIPEVKEGDWIIIHTALKIRRRSWSLFRPIRLLILISVTITCALA